jgi:hypothetical protein
VTAKDLAECLDLDKSAARRRLLHASDGGYVRNLEDRRGHPGRWVTDEPLPGPNVLLPPPEQLLATGETITPQGKSPNGGTVATDSEGFGSALSAQTNRTQSMGSKSVLYEPRTASVKRGEESTA